MVRDPPKEQEKQKERVVVREVITDPAIAYLNDKLNYQTRILEAIAHNLKIDLEESE